MDSEEREVLLHVYDLSGGMARTMSLPLVGKQIDGIWHTGVVLGGKEYFFGGGIQVAASGKTVYGTPVDTIKLGTTMLPDELVMDFLEEISDRFSAETYSLLHNNCNNFSDELATFLTGSGIPAHITGLPAEFLATPMGQMLMPMLAPMEAQMKAMQGEALFHGHPAHASAPPPAPATAAPAAAPMPAPKPAPAPAEKSTPAPPAASAAAARSPLPPLPFEYTPVGTMPPPVSATPNAPSKPAAGGSSRDTPVGGTAAAPPMGKLGGQTPAATAEAAAKAKSKVKTDFEEAVRQEFARLMSGGDMTANQAAAAAIKAAAAAKGKAKA
eukprot:jgi/Tetstr1/428355/TSEL_018390.t1